MKTYKLCVAGLGNVGSHVVENIIKNNKFLTDKIRNNLEIIGVSARDKNKKRIIDVTDFQWFDNPLELISDLKPDILIELIGEEKGVSYKLIKSALEKKINVITANKALLANHGNELFHLADQNQTLLLFEASVAGGIPIIKTIKQSINSNKIKKVSGILNGTTNYILSEMYKTNSDFNSILKDAQKKGFAEANSINDVQGIDSAHKLTILSTLSFGIKFNINNVNYKGISDISNDDIKFAKKLGYKIKLIGSTEIINNKIISIVEPIFVKLSSKLANVNGVLNGIEIETDYLDSLFLEGEGAGGKATASSIISDVFEIINKTSINSLGFVTKELKNIEKLNYDDRICSYYLKIIVKDLPGVLAKITSNLNDEGISIETILQLPENEFSNSNNVVPIIITTHETAYKLLNKVVNKIENLEFVVKKIVIISIDKKNI